MANNDMTKGLLVGVLAGAAVGLAIGILYAPRSGVETRELIREKTGAFASGLKERAGDFKDCVTAAVRGNKEQVEA